MKELLFILAFFVAVAVNLWPDDSDVQGDAWIEIHECDGTVFEIVTSNNLTEAFLTEFCAKIASE